MFSPSNVLDTWNGKGREAGPHGMIEVVGMGLDREG